MSFYLAIIHLGLQNLRLHKLRTFLTSLGIILGVAAVIVMVAIGEGKKQESLREIELLGATNVIVRSKAPPESPNFGSQERTFLNRYGLTRQDLRRIEHILQHVSGIVPLKAVGSDVSYGPHRIVSQTFGTTPELQRVANLRIEPGGRYLSAGDITNSRPVAIIGSEVARQFFRLENPIGRDIRIDDQVFRVVGVLAPVGLAGGSGASLVGRDFNDDVHVPISAAELMFGDQIMRRTSGSFNNEEVQLSEIYVNSASTGEVIRDAELVRRVVEAGHPEMRDVQIVVPWEWLELEKRAQRIWNIVLTAIAAISLLIGGIGIMNIMLASVTERTREIGIRRALGATRRHIIAQFLVETGSLSTLGGMFGIIFGIGLSATLNALTELDKTYHFFSEEVSLATDVTGWSIIVSFIVAASVGIIFGIYPAILAARKDVVVALRHD